jgi:hypothetical protein
MHMESDEFPPPPLTTPSQGHVLCPECGGKKVCPACWGDGETAPGSRCILCAGGRWCPLCGGRGQLPQDEVDA